MGVITVSREYGSGGEEIAQLVAKALGYNYFGKDILSEVAQFAHRTEEEISHYDEKDERGFRAFLKKLFMSYPTSAADFPYYYPPGGPLEWSFDHAGRGVPIGREQTLNADVVTAFFCEVIEKLWKRDNVVIIGRGSQKILSKKPNTLHVRFIGTMGNRGTRVMNTEGVTHYAEALKKVEAIDKLRAHYLKNHYDADWSNPKLYHLVINTSLMSDEQAVDVILAAVRKLQNEAKDPDN